MRNMNLKSISILGTGYVGLSIAIAFTLRGYHVNVFDPDKFKTEKIKRGILPFYEPALQEPLEKAVETCKLKCTSNCKEAVLDTDIAFVAVGTPSQPDGSINLNSIKKVASEIGDALKQKYTYHLIVIKSTVIPTTTEKIVKVLIENRSKKKCGTDFGLCMNPEFLREGKALHDILHPDRIIIGEYDKKSGNTLESLYKDFYDEELILTIRTNLSTAELIKYANNCFLATKISFINTLANICEEIPGADITTIAKAIGLDSRINPNFLHAGLGYGGSCFPKDLKALINFSKTLGYSPKLLKAVERVNDFQPQRAIELVKKQLGSLKGKKIAVLGLAFKPHTEDMREARSIPIIHQLIQEGAKVTVYDPEAIPNAKKIFENQIRYASSPTQCLSKADCCFLVTEWPQFKKLQPKDFTQNMRYPLIIDGRRIYNPKKFNQKIKFLAIGLGK